MEVQVAIQGQHAQYRGQDGEGRHDQNVGPGAGPGEDRHLHQLHTRRAHFEHGHQEVNAGEQGTDARYLQRPDVVIHPHARTEAGLRQRRIGHPAGLGEFTQTEGEVHQHGAGHRQPEAEVVQEGEGHVAGTDLQRQHYVHQADHEWHGHKDDHDDTVSGEDLVVVLGRQVAVGAVGRQCQLGPHHDGVGKAADQHDKGQNDIHDAQSLVVHRRDPIAPEHAPFLMTGNQEGDHHGGNGHHAQGYHDNGLVVGHGVECEFT